MPDQYPWGNFFRNRRSPATVRVDEVTENWASLNVQQPPPSSLSSSFKMPIPTYDASFVEQYVPIDTGAMRLPDNFRPPKNWAKWVAEGIPARNVVLTRPADDRDEDEIEADAMSEAEVWTDEPEAEDSSVTVKAPVAKVEDSDPGAIEEAVKARLAGRG